MSPVILLTKNGTKCLRKNLKGSRYQKIAPTRSELIQSGLMHCLLLDLASHWLRLYHVRTLHMTDPDLKHFCILNRDQVIDLLSER